MVAGRGHQRRESLFLGGVPLAAMAMAMAVVGDGGVDETQNKEYAVWLISVRICAEYCKKKIIQQHNKCDCNSSLRGVDANVIHKRDSAPQYRDIDGRLCDVRAE